MDLIKQFCESTADKVVKIYDNANSESEFIRITQEKYNHLLNSKPNQSIMGGGLEHAICSRIRW